MGEMGGQMTGASFSQCTSYRNNRRYYFGLFSYLNGNGNMPPKGSLHIINFLKLEKGDLKTLGNPNPQQNVYMVEVVKLKMMRLFINDIL